MTESYQDTRPPLPVSARTLPAEHFTDPRLFEVELARIFGRSWFCAGRAEEVPERGSYVVREIAGANVIVVRDERGDVVAHHNVCRHRGTVIAKDPAGCFPGRIRCPYHAWTYGLDGRLLAAPHMERTEGFRPAEHPLLAVGAALWDGHVFLNLADRPPPLAEQLGDLPEKFRPWRMEDLRRVERRVYEVRANWKLIVQNYSECLHCPTAHPLLTRHSHHLSGANDPPAEGYLGGRMDLRQGARTLSVDGGSNRACFAGLSADDRRRVYYYAVLPNLLLSLHPDYMLTCTLWPRAVDRTEIVCEWHFDPDAIAAGDFDPGGAIELWDVTNREDWELCERAHEGIATAGYRPGPYSNREELLHAFDRWVLARVGKAR